MFMGVNGEGIWYMGMYGVAMKGRRPSGPKILKASRFRI